MTDDTTPDAALTARLRNLGNGDDLPELLTTSANRIEELTAEVEGYESLKEDYHEVVVRYGAAEKRATEAEAERDEWRRQRDREFRSWQRENLNRKDAEAEVARVQGIVGAVKTVPWTDEPTETQSWEKYGRAVAAILAAPEKEGEQ